MRRKARRMMPLMNHLVAVVIATASITATAVDRLQTAQEQVIAVLTSDTGPSSAAMAPVSAGIAHAFTATAHPGQRLRFYATSRFESASAALAQAEREGAALVIGPLDKEEAAEIASRPSTMPRLLLNEVPGQTTPPDRDAPLYQFALRPDAEMRAVAERALAERWGGALMLYPSNPWGERLREAFEERYLEIGGGVSATVAYEPGTYDYASAIADVLVAARGPSFVLMIADAADARLLHRTLQYFKTQERNIPVIATSHINTADFSPTRDVDLVGMRFLDSPWMLDARLPTAYGLSDRPDRQHPTLDKSSFRRLFALGVDSIALAQALLSAPGSTPAPINGLNGTLTWETNGRIARTFAMGQMGDLGPQMVSAEGIAVSEPSPPSGLKAVMLGFAPE